MNTKTKKQIGVIVLLVLIIALMSVGFAAYSQVLNINGTVKVKPAQWSVHYVTNSYQESTGSQEASGEPSVTNTDWSYTVVLNKPGDFYEATVNVINDGAFDAKLTKITMSSLTAAQSKYLTYEVSYNGTTYTATTDGLAIELATNATAPVKVRVSYTLPSEAEDLPSTEQTVTVTGSLDFASKD